MCALNFAEVLQCEMGGGGVASGEGGVVGKEKTGDNKKKKQELNNRNRTIGLIRFDLVIFWLSSK